MTFPETIQTERLLLRPWEESDAHTLFHYACDPRIGPMCGWKPHESEEESLQVIRNILTADYTYAVTLEGEPIGTVSLMPARNPACIGHMELGYWLGFPHWGNGYIPEAAEALLKTAFGLGARELWCAHYAENHNSRRVIKKLGFSYRFRAMEENGLGQTKEVWYYALSRKTAFSA